MRSSSFSSSPLPSSDLSTPLVGNSDSQASGSSPSSCLARSWTRWNALALWKKIGLGLLMGAAASVGVGAVYLADTGAFEKINRTVKFENGTAIEPNTQMRFPVVLKSSLDGSPRSFKLYSLFMQARHVPEIEATLRVFVLACYAEIEQGRKELKKFKHRVNPPDNHSPEFTEVVDILSSVRVSTTCNYRMLMSPPGSYMQSAWLNALIKWWQERGVAPERVQALSDAFTARFAHFRNHDDFWWEFDNLAHPNGPTQARFNDKDFKAYPDAELGAALTAHEPLENGNICLNLLPTFFEN